MKHGLKCFLRSTALALPLLGIGASLPTKPVSPGEIVAQAPASAWMALPADDLLVIDLDGGRRVVIAPAFARVHVANIKALAPSGAT